MASQYERVLAAEMIAVVGVETLDALSGADTGKFSLPDPSRYFATVIVFAMLAAAAMFGDKAGKLAASFGGVSLIGMVAVPSKKSGRSPIMGALAYFNQVITGGVQGSGGTTTTTIVPGQTPNQYNQGGAAAAGVPSNVAGSPAFVEPPSPVK
jgi:hypothetical protein